MTTENDSTPYLPIMVSQSNLNAIKLDSIHDTLTTNDICAMFDEFLTEFELMEKSTAITTQMFLDAVEEITNAVLEISPHKLLDPRILAHKMILFLHQMLIDLLINWQATDMRLNIQETDIFLKIVLVFAHAMDHALIKNSLEGQEALTKVVATKKGLRLISEQIVDSNANKNGMNDDPNLCTLGLMTIKLLNKCEFYYSRERNIYLIDTLIYNCLDSFDYLQALRQLQNGELLNDIEKFLLYTCWEYIPFRSTTTKFMQYSTTFINSFYEDILNRFERTVQEHLSMHPKALAYIFEKSQQILSIPHVSSFEKHVNSIIDNLLKIVDKCEFQNPDGDASIIVVLQAFYHLAKNAGIRQIIRKRPLMSLFSKYRTDEQVEKQKLALAILAEIMSDDEISNNSSEMTQVLIDHLEQFDRTQYSPELDITLSCLNVLIQHEKFTEEFIEQGGLQKLVALVRDSDCEIVSEKQLADAISIIWSCTFDNPEVINQLKQDEQLMAHVNSLAEKSKKNENSTLQKATESLIWKVEKKEKFLVERAAEVERRKSAKKQRLPIIGVDEEKENEDEAPKYDMMISYCWAEMDLAHRIFSHLTEHFGYRIWIDKEQMHGSTIEAMANAVDGAEFILMCMSESYKRSANCKSEAEYAFNRKKHIVPIKMIKDYVPDGWLGFILGTRMYIDFGTYEFEQAVKLLDNEIQLQKKKRRDVKEMRKVEREAEGETESKENKDDEKEKVALGKSITKSKCNSENVLDWNDKDVLAFLMKHNLDAMVPLCNGTNGEELKELYCMCRVNSTAMYRSLKYELSHGHNRILPIATYLRFLNRAGLVCSNDKRSFSKNDDEVNDENL